MVKRTTSVDLAKAAARAHCDLNIFYAVIALMEGSFVSSECFGAEARIVAICKAEAQKCLHRYDRALARLPAAQLASGEKE